MGDVVQLPLPVRLDCYAVGDAIDLLFNGKTWVKGTITMVDDLTFTVAFEVSSYAVAEVRMRFRKADLGLAGIKIEPNELLVQLKPARPT